MVSNIGRNGGEGGFWVFPRLAWPEEHPAGRKEHSSYSPGAMQAPKNITVKWTRQKLERKTKCQPKISSLHAKGDIT